MKCKHKFGISRRYSSDDYLQACSNCGVERRVKRLAPDKFEIHYLRSGARRIVSSIH